MLFDGTVEVAWLRPVEDGNPPDGGAP